MTTARDAHIVEPGSAPKLSDIATDSRGDHDDKASAVVETAKLKARLSELQYLMYADGRQSLLICLQALDAAGKDGTIRHVIGAMNPQGTRVHAFKVPSAEEADHDFLWRAHFRAPAQGEVVVFNRSHYEDVLVVRVHGLVRREVWKKRYELINEFEQGLVEHNTLILKFYLHLSQDEQLKRFNGAWTTPHTGRSARPTTPSASSGPRMWTPTRRCSKTAPSTRRGLSFPPTTSGSVTWPSHASWRRRWSRPG